MIALEFNRTLRSLPSYLDVKPPIFSPKPYLIYKKTKNLRVIQLLLGHKKLESTVRYLGIESMMR